MSRIMYDNMRINMGDKNFVPGSWVLVFDSYDGVDKRSWYISKDELDSMVKLSKNKKNSLKSEDFIELTWKDSYNISYQLLFNKVCYDRKEEYRKYDVVFYRGRTIVYQWILSEESMEKLLNEIVDGKKKIDLGMCEFD